MTLTGARVRRILALSVLTGLLAGSLGLVAPAAAAESRAFIDPNLRVQEGVTSGLVHLRPGASYAGAVVAAKAAGLVVGSRYQAIGVFAAAGPVDAFERLADSAAIELVESNQPIAFFTDSAHRATRGQDVLDGAVNGTPYTGAGVGVAVVDSGVDGTHPDLVSRMGDNVKIVCSTTQGGVGTFFTPFNQCAGPRTAVPLADTDTTSLGGHGTHVAGIIAGDGTASDGRYHGSAPGATIYGVSAGTFASMTDALDGLAWVLENHDKVSPPIRVVNNSWGTQAGDYCGTEADPCDEDEIPPFGPTEGRFHKAIWKLQEELVEAGVTVVMAAGNAYGTGYAPTTTAECTNPTPGIVCVANYFDRNSGTRDEGEIHGSSSRGEWQHPETWPDVTAPGSAITAACRSHLPICRTLDESAGSNGEYYATLTGTSMAAPNVAGIVAQVLEANPSLTPAQIEDLLEDTAYKFAWGSDYGLFGDGTNPENSSSYEKGHGMVDALAAVRVGLGLDGAPGPSIFPAESPELPLFEDEGLAFHWNFTSITETEFRATCNRDLLASQSIDAHVFEVPEQLRDKQLRVRIGGSNPIPFYDVGASFYGPNCTRLGGAATGGDENASLPANTRYIVVNPGLLAYVTTLYLEYYDVALRPTVLSLDITGKGSNRVLTALLTDAAGTPLVGKNIEFFADSVSIGTAVTDTSGRATLQAPPPRASTTAFSAAFHGDGRFGSSTADSS